MSYDGIIALIDEIKLIFGDDGISKVNILSDEDNKSISVSIVTKSPITVIEKDKSIIHKILMISDYYMIKVRDNNLVISFELKWES